MFGESLPDDFFDAFNKIKRMVDLVIVIGTALAVTPFNQLHTEVKEGVPKVLFNMNNTKETGGIDFTESGRNKLFVQGKCDETLRKLVTDCEWTEEFDSILPDFHKQTAATT